jgi:hypothetical protein
VTAPFVSLSVRFQNQTPRREKGPPRLDFSNRSGFVEKAAVQNCDCSYQYALQRSDSPKYILLFCVLHRSGLRL